MNQTRDTTDWLLFCALSLLWASAYAMTRGAVYGEHGLPVGLIIPARLVIGAVILNIAIFATGRRYPPVKDWKRWLVMAAMGFMGMAAPFSLITWAQQTVDSSLAALYVSATPIFVVLGANVLFADEKLTSRTGTGIAMGFLGVVVLLGPDAFANFGSASVIAQFVLVVATAFYASSTLLARAAPKIEPIVFAAGFVSLGALMSLPMLATVNFHEVTLTPVPVLSVIGLGIGPSALASLVYMALVQRAGATFLSLTGYAIPVLAAIIGFVLFRETLQWNALVAFALILSGIWLAQRARKATPGVPTP